MSIDPSHVRWSTPKSNYNDDLMLMMLHGWGYDERHLFALVPYLPDNLAVASLRAPTAEGPGYAWIPSAEGPIGNPYPAVANAAAFAILSWLDTVPRQSRVGLLGYSQGAAVAMQLLRHAPTRFTFVVSLAGFIVNDVQAGDNALARLKPPIFWGRGAKDDVIPADSVRRTVAWLNEHADPTVKVYPEVTHDAVQPEVIRDVSVFVESHQ